MATTLIFLIVLTVLVFVHELGHFLAARLFKIRVDEFAIGFPPQLWSKVWGKTRYALNLLPLGGYVRIYGESPEDEMTHDSILAKPRWQQAIVLIAGVTFNIVFAWLLLSTSLVIGSKTDTEGFPPSTVHDQQILIDFVAADSPAAQAGIKPGDQILSISDANATPSSTTTLTVSAIQSLIASSSRTALIYKENDQEKTVAITPIDGIVPGKKAIGISMSEVGTIQMNPAYALYYGAIQTYNLSVSVGQGLWSFIGSIFVGKANLKDVSGPVGIAGVVGQASRMGFAYLVTITAVISVNLAAINVIPFPALDGGRLVVVAIEAIIRRRIKMEVINWINVVGFVLLLSLMLIVTFKDIIQLFH